MTASNKQVGKHYSTSVTENESKWNRRNKTQSMRTTKTRTKNIKTARTMKVAPQKKNAVGGRVAEGKVREIILQ